ncbi:TRAP transporter substrate-binding protein DctP [Clostridium sp. MD294]|uniref:TRAP transporter substrate-binding protein DctP n=1 Tax=Clostridium sp. MD294 TaxID=97138 RepID=UPI0002CAB777|nr:TRAP transporter substrate-binding protein DctP [Clostridium sp. MD294]NDO45937.1 C4-dicarboxylate ABC transporter [Clostridium sp. MD294]USF30404.1 Ectoine-binding periplasmic protein TeaA [Clostridium sp. MD294]
MIKKVSLFLTAIFCITMLSSCSQSTSANAEDVTIWRLSHEESAGSMQDMYAMKFKQLIEEKSNGEIQVNVYTLGQLGDSVGAVEMLRYGVVDFAINNPATVATIIPENQLFTLHFVFSDDSEVNSIILNEGETVKEMNELYQQKDIVPLGWFNEGFQVISSQKEIRTPSDMKGMKVRVMASPLLFASYAAYGANPTSVPYMECYSNLQLNMIDSVVQPTFAMEEMKFYEVSKYLNYLNHELFVGTFCSNTRFWENLPQQQKQLVESCLPELAEYIVKVEADYSKSRLEKIKQNSDIIINEFTEEEREEFKKLSSAGRDKYISLVGEEGKRLLELLSKDLEAAEKTVND